MASSCRRAWLWLALVAFLVSGAPSWAVAGPAPFTPAPFTPAAGAGAGAGAWLIGQTDDRGEGDPPARERKKRRRKRRRKARRQSESRRTKPPKQTAVPAPEAKTPEAPPVAPKPTKAAASKAEGDRAKRILEGRKQSRVTEGTPSRWSNRGAMVPVVSEVPVAQPLPERSVPRPAGVATVGQRLQGRETLISTRVSFGYYRFETNYQDQVFRLPDPTPENPNPTDEVLTGDTNNLDLIRARATLSFQRIDGTDFGVQVDGEFRPQLGGRFDSRPTDFRLNELYVSYGRTDWRRRRTGPSWGLALGRVTIREAGFAQADGLAARFRLIPELMVGAWGGVTGNPYGYDWFNQEVEFFSLDWYTAGAFVSLLFDRVSINLAGGTTIANIDAENQGVDRIYVYLDGAAQITEGLNLLVNGWIDVLPDGDLFQSIDLIAAYQPLRSLAFTAAFGRFSTVVFDNSRAVTYPLDPNGNRVGIDPVADQVIFDANGQPANSLGLAQLSSVYNSIRFRAGYRIIPELETFVRWTTLFRDTTITDEQFEGAGGTESNFSSVRSRPTVGVRYSNPDVIDANVGFTYIIDERATANSIVRGGIGRGWRGIYAGADARAFFGEIDGFDGGVQLSYTFPRSWLVGALSVRGAFRYFRENVELFLPGEDQTGVLAPGETPNTRIPFQESLFGYAGIEWRY